MEAVNVVDRRSCRPLSSQWLSIADPVKAGEFSAAVGSGGSLVEAVDFLLPQIERWTRRLQTWSHVVIVSFAEVL
jgi:hypothetical protein